MSETSRVEEATEEETMSKSSTTTADAASRPEGDRKSAQVEGSPLQTSTDTAARPTVQTPAPKRRGTRVLVVAGGVTVLVLALVIAYFAFWTLGRSTERLTETFSGSIDQVVVEDVNGSVTLEAGTGTEVTVEQEWLFGDAPDVQMTEDEGTLRITANCGSFCRTHITGTAPTDAKIVVRTEAGSIDVTGFESGVDLSTSAGNVRVTDIVGPAMLRSDAGSIRGDVSEGDVDAQTSAVGIELEVLGDFSRILAVSDAGSVHLTVPDDVYRVEAETSVGRTRVNVSTDPDAPRVIISRSSAGNVTIDRMSGSSS